LHSKSFHNYSLFTIHYSLLLKEDFAMKDDHHILQVTLDGTQYTLRSDASIKRLQEIADKVEEKITLIRKIAPALSSNRVAMLTALHLAEDLLKMKDEYEEILAEADIGGRLF
jgi:cell division protein ZapA